MKRGEADGLIIHKIDRSARNLRDWADLGDLIDSGIDVRFAHDDLDLGSRGGRLAADIQAVIAADYIRNLSEEVRKGVHGRLRQGLYPLPAPHGYVDHGRGEAKTIDLIKGPVVRELFERYATGRFTLTSLANYAFERGLTSAKGKRLHLDSISRMLRNPFYVGVLRVESHEETFPGIHEPLIDRATFDQVQSILNRHEPAAHVRHTFTYSRLLTCTCGRHLVGEEQKGHVYYRCHQCPGSSVREEQIDEAVSKSLATIRPRLAAEFQKLSDSERRDVLKKTFVASVDGQRVALRPASGVN